MKKALILSLGLLLYTFGVTKAEKLSYFYDAGISFDSKIPTPEQFLGYEIGSRITEHSRINAYFEKLAEISDRTSLIEIGQTHERRKIYVLAVSSPENIKRLNEFQGEREKVRKGDTPSTPLILFLGNTVHGNESSASESSLLSAYYLVAGQGEKVIKELNDGIYFVDPVRNPDGLERFASWVNSNAGVNVQNDYPLDREHTEAWLRGRGNHYWFDMNRDWINIVQPESQARVAFYQSWLPHVQADHHEMGTNSTFFFEPTDPNGTESRYIPQATYKLNAIFGDYYAKALDKIGSFYYTKESYDNKNPNFGSTYPDFNGSVGILFEQGSSRGIQQQSENGLVTYAFTVRNQLVASLATIDAAINNRDGLFNLQKEYFTTYRKDKEATKSYIIGDKYDVSRLNKFVNLLLSHHLDVYQNDKETTINGVKYEKGKSYIVPVGQPNSALIKIIFDDKTDYTDLSKLGYGAGFSVAYSYGLSYGASTAASRGTKITAPLIAEIKTLEPSEYAYIVDYRDSKSQQLLFRLLEKDILVKTAFLPFSINTYEGIKDFSYGSLLIAVKNQTINSDELYKILQTLSEKEGVNIVPVSTGYSIKGVDLGSSAFKKVEKPNVLVVTDGGTSSTESGEVWHLFDQKLSYPLARVDYNYFKRAKLSDFNRIVFTSGDYSFLNKSDIQNLKDWVKNGGTLITFNNASRWAIQNELADGEFVKEKADSLKKNSGSNQVASFRLPTSIFETRVNLEHPIAFGLTSEKLPISKENVIFLAPSKDPVNTVATYSESPLLNGYLSPEHKSLLAKSASIQVTAIGSGNVVVFSDNPVFRGIWDATERTFINSIVFGSNIGDIKRLRY